jgi:hypothetical protein
MAQLKRGLMDMAIAMRHLMGEVPATAVLTARGGLM